MTRRAQLVVLAVLLLLLVLGIWFPAHTQGDQPVAASRIPASGFVPVRSVGPAPDAPPTPNASPATGNWPVPSASPRPRATLAARATTRPLPASREASRTGPTEKASAATVSQSRAVSGVASWWASFGPGVYAALPGYVVGTHVTVRVCSGSRCVLAPVVTSCGCYIGTPDERIVDVSPGILAALGLDPAAGIYPITVERLP